MGQTTPEDNGQQRHFRFLADLSHEVRSPLNAIIGFSQLLNDDAFGPLTDDQRAVVDDILCAGQHLLRLINDVLDISRISASRLELQPEVLSVAAVVEQALTVARGLALERQVELRQEVSVDLAIWADERRVTQVLYNLLANAIKFSPAGATVLVKAEPVDDEAVRTSVIDHGCGVKPEDQQRIFEDFVAIPAPDEDGPSAGLGLSVSRRLVEFMGGEIGVVSGGGTTNFTFTLPRDARPQ